jgi:hypothetical protein
MSQKPQHADAEDELDNRIRGLISPAFPEDVRDRIRAAIPAEPRTGARWPYRRWALAAGACLVVAAAAIALLPRPEPASADEILARMARALDGKCLKVEMTSGSGRETQRGEWACIEPGQDQEGLTWSIRRYTERLPGGLPGVHYAWWDGTVREYHPASGCLTISYAHYGEWAEHNVKFWRWVQVLAGRAGEGPKPAVELVAQDDLDGRRCDVIHWQSVAAAEETSGPPESQQMLERLKHRDVSQALWWIDRKTRLPVMLCDYSAPLDQPTPTLGEAKALLADEKSRIYRLTVVPHPGPGFFELADMEPQETHDLRDAQAELMRSQVAQFDSDKARLTVRAVASSEDGRVYIALSVLPVGAPQAALPHLTTLGSARTRLSCDRRMPWQMRASLREGSRSVVMGGGKASVGWGVSVSERGTEYLPSRDRLFGMDNEDAFMVTLTPVKIGKPPRPDDRVTFTNGVWLSTPYTTEPTGGTRISTEAEVSISIPPPSVPAGEPPPFARTAPQFFHSARQPLTYTLPWALEGLAGWLRWEARFHEALNYAKRAEQLYPSTGEPVIDPFLGQLNHVEPMLFMDIYVDLGDAEMARHYAELAREELESLTHLSDGQRQNQLDHIERALAYLEGTG